MSVRPVAGATVLLMVGGLVLAGCTQAPLPAVTVTSAPLPAATVTATPAPPSADTPLDALGAWTACAGFLEAYVRAPAGHAGVPNPNTFSLDLVTQSGRQFYVQYAGTLGQHIYNCTLSGTYGRPIITDWITER